MSLADRRKALGYSQEGLARALEVDRTTVYRWETYRALPQPPLRPKLAELLEIGLAELDSLVAQPPAESHELTRTPSCDHLSPGEVDHMIRREFLRATSMAGALAVLPVDEAEALEEATRSGGESSFTRMSSHLWQVYRLARSKRSVHPIVRDQLRDVNDSLNARSGAHARSLWIAAGDLFQLAGELSFDSNRYADAAASYTLAASASKDAGAYDLWACALVRHAYVDVYEGRYREASGVLAAAQRVAGHGDSSLSTRHWVAAAQAEAFAGMGDLSACERALEAAEKVTDLAPPSHQGGWLRFDGSRLAEERGSRYVTLGRLDLAEQTLTRALNTGALVEGHSFRRRGAVLTDLAVIGAKRRDVDQVIAFGREAVRLARETSSGYIVRRLHGLRAEIRTLARDRRIAELKAEIGVLSSA
ncbi:helix-turn-helix transcriptional regulator [Streptomyces sp. NPDC001889]